MTDTAPHIPNPVRSPWGGPISRPAVLFVARRIADRDALSRPRSLRKALAWARSKAPPPPADPLAAARAHGIYSPRDRTADADAHFARVARRNGGSQFWGGR